jgi:hypothetical protein
MRCPFTDPRYYYKAAQLASLAGGVMGPGGADRVPRGGSAGAVAEAVQKYT